MNFEDLSPELQDKVRACQTAEEILALAKQEGYELSDEELSDLVNTVRWTTRLLKDVYGVDCTTEIHPETGRVAITYLPAN